MNANDLNLALADVQGRINRRGPSQESQLEAYANEEDRRRQELIRSLIAAQSDPAKAAFYREAADATYTSGKNQVERDAAKGEADLAAAAGLRGMLGSSSSNFRRGAIAGAKDLGLRGASEAAEDTAIELQQADEDQLAAALRSILAPTSAQGGGGQALIAGAQQQVGFNRLGRQNEDQYRGALSQALGSFLSNGVGGATKMGFDRADRLNAADERLWRSSGGSGPPPRANRTFTLWE